MVSQRYVMFLFLMFIVCACPANMLLVTTFHLPTLNPLTCNGHILDLTCLFV
jgi:hypothetical protein